MEEIIKLQQSSVQLNKGLKKETIFTDVNLTLMTVINNNSFLLVIKKYFNYLMGNY